MQLADKSQRPGTRRARDRLSGHRHCKETVMPLTALALNGTLKSSGGDPSSTDRMLGLIADGLKKQGVATRTIRLADHDIKPGVTSDEGKGDAWPDIRKAVLAADILVVGTPIWLGQP